MQIHTRLAIVQSTCFEHKNVTKLRFSCLLFKKPILRDKHWIKGKITLLKKLAILRRRGTHVPKNQFLTADQGKELFKRSFRGAQVWEDMVKGSYMKNSTTNSKNYLEIGHVVIWSASSSLF